MCRLDKHNLWLYLHNNAPIYGKIIIVTNASLKWINISSDNVPKTKKLLNNIKVVSARDNYQHVGDIYQWKTLSFIDQIKEELSHHNYANIISIGDAEYEYKALINLFHHIILAVQHEQTQQKR